MPGQLKSMKWWGWGDQDKEFDISARPELWPYIESSLKLSGPAPVIPPVSFDSIVLPELNCNPQFSSELERLFGAVSVRSSKEDRLIHAFGKSFRDLWRVRKGIVPYAPDCVVWPRSEHEVNILVEAATRHGAQLIPFGGGSNIAGCLEPLRPSGRFVVSVDMRRMERLIALDKESGTARFEAGVLGPRLEAQLNASGYTLGHFPDSFLFSTLGGWVATRSAGMQSDLYGKIDDMVVAIRMVTPSGIIETRAVPRASNGIDVNRLCIGSEGALGIITEVLLAVHPLPERRAVYGYLFRDFKSGIHAMRQCLREGCRPALARLNDPDKTALSFAYKNKPTFLKKQISGFFKTYLRQVRRFDFDNACLMLVGFEGTKEAFGRDRRKADAIYKTQGAVPLGTQPGIAFEAGKYDFPYLRDFLCDRGIIADVSETAIVWSRLIDVYDATRKAVMTAIENEGAVGWIGCHVSHSYHAGASLYFTFGFPAQPSDELTQYLRVKKAAEDAFLACGATLSHHHAVGYEHLPWLESDISTAGVKAVLGLKHSLDPLGVMNPGKLAPGITFEEWGLPASAKPGPSGPAL